MSVRDRIRGWLGVDGRIRDEIREAFAARSLPSATEIESLRDRITKLEKKLDMTMGAVQASTHQLMGLHTSVESVQSMGAKSEQRSTMALTTAEANAEGISSVEEQLATILDELTAQTNS